MAKVNKIIGIDISKEKFDACFSFNENEKSVQDSYSYDEKGIRQFLKEVQDDCICVMEATGVYHLRLAYALYERRVSVSIVNPLSVKNFSRAVILYLQKKRRERIFRYLRKENRRGKG